MPVSKKLAGLFAATALAAGAGPAFAVDGCKVLLCLAGNWKNIAECQSEVRQALRDVAKGKGWPECKTNEGGGSSATGATQASTDGNCYEWFKIWYWTDLEAGGYWDFYCAYPGYVDTWIEGKHWARHFYDWGGSNTLDEWDTAAREALGYGNQRMGADLVYDNWVANGSPTGAPPPPPPKEKPPEEPSAGS